MSPRPRHRLTLAARHGARFPAPPPPPRDADAAQPFHPTAARPPRLFAIALHVGSLALAALAAAGEPPRLFPAPDATEVCPDTPLRLAFAVAPSAGANARIRVHDADGRVVETIAVDGSSATTTIGSGTYQYHPAIVSGAELMLFPRHGALGYDRTYYVTADAGACQLAGAPSAAIAGPHAWRFTTKRSPPARDATRLVVAADGTGDFCTVQGAIDFVPAGNTRPIVLEIRRGTYVEMVNIPADKPHLTLRGEDRQGTVISYANNARFNPRVRSVVDVYADDFALENLTLRNTTPQGGSQAEALRYRGDRAVLDHCDFRSLQDTLQLTGRIYVNACYAEGDVDFVWGSGTVYFHRCELKALNNGYLVQSRNGAERPGYIFADCALTAAPGVSNTLLARIEPARFPFSHVAFLDCTLGPHIAAVGWQFDRVPGSTQLGGTERIQFQEFNSTSPQGQPIDTRARLAPSRQLTADEAAALRDVARVLGGGDHWDPLSRLTHP